MKIAREILQEYWGYTDFRPSQAKIIEAVLDKKDTLALLPTGGGKSVCFQIPALIKEGVCIVISPLVALMQDQVTRLKEKNIKATTIATGSSSEDIVRLFDTIKFGNYKFLYISPERLQTPLIQEKIKELKVALVAIDEAHCISEWGHDFRPSYRNIEILRTLHPNTPFIALTASATTKVIHDICTNLSLQNPEIVKNSFLRKNVAYQIFTVEDKLNRLLRIFSKTKRPAIVYVNTRHKTKKISAFLNANGFKSSFYHGGLSVSQKEVAFKNWMSEKTPIIVATNAFGMGIDKPNVGVVVHLDVPNSIENYLQEAGRAGRNGEKSFAVTLQNSNDILVFKDQLENTLPTIALVKEVYRRLFQYFHIANGELITTSFELPISLFCEQYNFSRSKTTAVLQILSNYGIVALSNHFQERSKIQFIANSNYVILYKKQHKKIGSFIDLLLRTYGGLFEKETAIDEFQLAKKAGTTSEQVIQYLEILDAKELLVYKPTSKHPKITFLLPREDDKTINPIAKKIGQYLTQKQHKATNLIRFIENNRICRSIQVLHYFDEKNTTKCGICDVCLAEKKADTSQINHQILNLLAKNPLSSQEISGFLTAKEKDILIHLRNLLASNTIKLNATNQFYIP